jgi:hypothetical protein
MQNQSQYINTMVFAIVAGIISLMLLLLVMNANEMVREYSPFIITFEVGLVIIIVIAIWRIIAYESKIKKDNANGVNQKLHVDSCPDYWTRFGNSCIASQEIPGTFGKTIRVLGPVVGPVPDISAPVSTIKITDYDNQSIATVCNKIRPTGNNNLTVRGPWTDVRSVCDSYRIDSTSA